MAKIKIAVAGCLGRMGQELSKQIINNNKLEFVGGFEHKKHKDVNKQFKNVSDINSTKLIEPHPANSIKTANVIIDFTTPQSTFCLLYTSPSPRDVEEARMPSSA